jgi:hypothetical protein
MVPAWVALAAWLVCWTALAWLSMGMLKKVRPGETVPMRVRYDGGAAWRVQPAVAAVFTPILAFVVGMVTLVVGFGYGSGKVPGFNVALAAVFVFAHWSHMTTAVKVLERERR